MNHTEKDNNIPAKPTGRRYTSVKALMAGENVSKEVRSKVSEIAAATNLVHQLSRVRHLAGLTQEDLAKRLGVTQSAISKLESGRDEELTIAQISEYAKATNERISVYFGKPLNHVEAVKCHAFGIRHHLSALASMAHEDSEMEKAIQGFFGEAFFNLLTILSKCQGQMPNASSVEVRMDIMESPTHHKGKEKCADAGLITA